MNIDLLLLLFLILGMLTAGGIFLVNKLRKRYLFTIPVWIFLSMGLIFLIFSIAWAISSLVEYEPQAAGMGLLIFGGIALIFFSLAARFSKKRVNLN